MKEYFKIMGLVLLLVISIAIIGFTTKVFSLSSFAFFAPKVEQVRYNTFKQSQAYQEGMQKDMEDLKLQYAQANPEQKQMIAEIMRRRFNGYDVTKGY